MLRDRDHLLQHTAFTWVDLRIVCLLRTCICNVILDDIVDHVLEGQHIDQLAQTWLGEDFLVRTGCGYAVVLSPFQRTCQLGTRESMARVEKLKSDRMQKMKAFTLLPRFHCQGQNVPAVDKTAVSTSLPGAFG